MKELDLFDLSAKVAVVTGASKGIGKAMAEALAAYGAKVVVNSRKQEDIDIVAKEINDAGYEAIAIEANIGDFEQARALIDKTIAHYGGVDIIVNNAATNPVYGASIKTDEAAFEQIMQVNVQGIFELCKQALSSMQERGGGSIINISSISGLKPEPGVGIYSVSKSALIQLSNVMAYEWGKYNIRVNSVAPGLIKTKFSEAMWSNDAVLKHFLATTPLKRVGNVEDLKGIAVYLASDASSYATGGVYLVDGGYLLS
ncbi:MAG TPA: glucose 1-dehydrogenase [Trueperaceae bacterium]|nr:glucose 1-dehydrogenase [Trueperaceae bacterium]